MGILGSLFGGGGGTTKIGKKASKQLWDRTTAVADKPFVPYEGDRVAPTSPGLLNAINSVSTAPSAGSAALNAAIDMAKIKGNYTPITVGPVGNAGAASAATIDRRAVGTLAPKSLLDYDVSAYMNPYLGEVAGSTVANLELARARQRMADNDAAVKAGAFGGSRQAVNDALTTEAYDRNMATALADLYRGGFDTATGLLQTDIGREFDAARTNQATDLSVASANASNQQQVNLANQANEQANLDRTLDIAKTNQSAGLTANQQGIAAAGLLSDTGATQSQTAVDAAKAAVQGQSLLQSLSQAKADADYEEFLRQQGYDASMIKLLQGSADIAAGTRSNQTNGVFGGGGQSGAGSLLSAASLFGISDRRLKRNVVRIGALPNGLNIYEFDFVWGGDRQRGVMADEVERIMPDAVALHPSGYKMVDYAMIGDCHASR